MVHILPIVSVVQGSQIKTHQRMCMSEDLCLKAIALLDCVMRTATQA